MREPFFYFEVQRMIAGVSPHRREQSHVAKLRKRPAHLGIAHSHERLGNLVDIRVGPGQLVADVAQVTDFEQSLPSEVLLDSKIPLLRISLGARALDELRSKTNRLSHRYGAELRPELGSARAGKAVSQQERGRDSVIRGGKIAAGFKPGAGGIRTRNRRTEEDSISGTDDGPGSEELPGKSDARRKVVIVAVINVSTDAVPAGEGDHTWCIRHRIDGNTVEAILAIVDIKARRVRFPAHAKVQGESRAHFPIVVHEQGEIFGASIQQVGVQYGSRVRKSQKKTGDCVARVGHSRL